MNGTSPFYNQLAVAFMVFWLMTIDKSVVSWRVYLLRTIPVVVYAVVAMPDHGMTETNIEWTADGMVWYHFFSVIFLIGRDLTGKQ